MRSLYFNFFPILLFALLTPAITAQVHNEDVPVTTLGTITNDDDIIPHIYKLCLDENDQLTFYVNVLLDNLWIEGDYGVLPSFYEDMYVEFSVNGETAYTQVGNFDIVTLESGYTAFSFIAESPVFDFSDECEDNEDGFVDVVVSYRLVESIGVDLWDTYPACDYENTLFTCYVYPYAPWCASTPIYGFAAPDDPVPTCYDSWFSGSYAAWLYCDCPVDEPMPHEEDKAFDDGGDYIDGGDESSTREVQEGQINVYPNPMESLLNIESDQGSIRKIEMYSSRGDLIVNNVYNSDQNYNVVLNTAELANGLYLTRIVTDSGTKVIKVLK